MMMTPLHITLLIHYHCIAEKFHPQSPSASEYTAELLKEGLIESTDSPSGYQTTSRGKVHIEGLLALPFPQWVSPVHLLGNQIKPS